MARQLLRQRRSKQASDPNEDLFGFIVRLNHNFERPAHFEPMRQVLESVVNQPQNILIAAPPRHAKTCTVHGALERFIVKRPDLLACYVTYGAELSEDKSRGIRERVQKAGIELSREKRSLGSWRTKQGGGLDAVGVGGPVLGKGYHLIVVDDPLKNRAEAESPVIRRRVNEFVTATLFTRKEPGTSVIITHQRLHVEDMIGQLKDQPAWKYFKFPAISDSGEALWPSRWPKKELLKIRSDSRLSDYDWASQYMCEPVPRGGAVFRDVHFYRTDSEEDADSGLPKLPDNLMVGIGLDLAYSAKTYSDHSVIVVAGYDIETDRLFILEVIRAREEAPVFMQRIRAAREKYRWPRTFWWVGGQEKGIVDLLRQHGIIVHTEAAKQDKFVRAQPVSGRWNAGHVLVPRNAPWLDAFTSEILAFTGVGDSHDDQVDALAAAEHILVGKKVARGMGKTPFGGFF